VLPSLARRNCVLGLGGRSPLRMRSEFSGDGNPIVTRLFLRVSIAQQEMTKSQQPVQSRSLLIRSSFLNPDDINMIGNFNV
jgi:hypothetical protein